MTSQFDPGGRAFYASLARHLGAISSDVAEIERLIATLSPEADTGLAHETLVTLQKIDHIRQRIADLATLFESVGQDDVCETTVIDRITLAETRGLLNGVATKPQIEAGDLDLF
ncbi:hypothetical protein [uncultured Tateyamaria sp.]|uniref:hypothetical protein n=1 Tax=Tateyamaria sp. 1078 TaxID=3417464 RepID=UPI00260BCBDB|nr:hypothetical protein [uncultured Tateyamaria sp.]